MGAFHGVLALVVVGCAILVLVGGGLASGLDRGHELVRRAALVGTAVFAGTAAVGVAALLTGPAPGEGLHLLYGVALIGVMPLALAFAADAPPRARSGVMSVAGLAALLLAWRLFATG